MAKAKTTPRVLDEPADVKLMFAAWLKAGETAGHLRYERGVHRLPAGTVLPSTATVVGEAEAKEERAKMAKRADEPTTLSEMTPKTGTAV